MRFILLILVTLFACSCSQQPTVIPVDKPIQTPWSAEVVKVDELDVVEPFAHEFDLQLEDGRRILGKLEVKTPKESHEKVVKFINKSVGHPKAVLLKEMTGFWQIDLILTVPECEEEGCAFEEVSLTEWLKANNLAWD